MERVVIGVDPHKLSATIEVVDQRENLLGSGRFTTDKAGYAAMRKYVEPVAGPGVGGRGQPRRGPSVGAAAVGGRRAGRRCAGQARRPGTAARHRPRPQDRRPRRALGRGRRGPRQGPARARPRRPARGAADAGRPPRPAVESAGGDRQPAATAARRTHSRARRRRTSPPCRPRRSWPACVPATSPARPAAGSPPTSWPIWSRSRRRSRPSPRDQGHRQRARLAT